MEKTFVELREKLNKKAVHKDSGSVVYSKSISGYMDKYCVLTIHLVII